MIGNGAEIGPLEKGKHPLSTVCDRYMDMQTDRWTKGLTGKLKKKLGEYNDLTRFLYYWVEVNGQLKLRTGFDYSAKLTPGCIL